MAHGSCAAPAAEAASARIKPATKRMANSITNALVKLLLALLLAGAISAHAREVPEWFAETMLDARDEAADAAKHGKRLMLYFWLEGCPYCQRMTSVTFRDPAVLEIGAQLLRVLSLSGLFITIALTYTGGLQGTGDTKSPLYISIISQIIVPLGICAVIKELGTLEPIHIWIAILVGHATRCVLSVVRFNQGKWRSIAVDVR